MSTNSIVLSINWPFWRKALFRFLFIFLFIYNAPWTWFDYIIMSEGWESATYFHQFEEWLTHIANTYVFHIKGIDYGGELYLPGWVRLLTFLLLALIGCIVWSAIDYKRKNYEKLEYWLRTLVRYSLCITAFSYGIEKVFCLQMDAPTQTELATPLGFFSPFRLTWVYIGYSAPYQMFTGLVEVLAGTLLLFRKTALLGLLVALGVFVNVLMLNLAYDIPVKVFAMQLVFYCLYLLAFEYKRLYAFFIQNKVHIAPMYMPAYAKRWERMVYIITKSAFFILAVPLMVYDIWTYKNQLESEINPSPIVGRYNVSRFILNNDSITPYLNKSRWDDIIFENGEGSIYTFDTLFKYHNSRAWFLFEADTTEKTIDFYDAYNDTLLLCSFQYAFLDTNKISLSGLHGDDTLYIEMYKSRIWYQLSQENFSWYSD